MATGQSPNVLLVGPAGTPGAQYTSIQAAVNAANPGDWILVAPGVYHEKGSNGPTASQVAGVMITKPDVHLRGMDRNGVIVDGTNPQGTLPAGSPACSNADAAQDLGPTIGGQHVGRNGIEAYKTSGVYIENMTICNYLSVNGAHTGNEVWWNAGDGSGQTQPQTAWGSYLTGTSTYFKDSSSAHAMYGIFASNIAPDPGRGTSVIDYTYANNMADSAYYIGACPDCNIVLRHAHAQNSALGYSGTNGSGRVIIENGEWDHLHAGIVPNTLNNDDAPSPQTGVRPRMDSVRTRPGRRATIASSFAETSCTTTTTPITLARASPAPHLLVSASSFRERSSTWSSTTSSPTTTRGGSSPTTTPTLGRRRLPIPPPTALAALAGAAVPASSPSSNNFILNNVFFHNGSNGNTTNGDIANEQLATDLVTPGKNCFAGNTNPGGLQESPSGPTGLQETSCSVGNFDTGLAASQLVCASGIITAVTGLPITCSALPTNTFNYPSRSVTDQNCAKVAPGSVMTPPGGTDASCMMTLAATLAQASLQPKMDPCVGPPPNAYCPAAATTTTTAIPVLPNTASGRALLPLGAIALGVGGALALVVLAPALSRRRRA